jgi:hypothetical protein
MAQRRSVCAIACVLAMVAPIAVSAQTTITVAAGGNLQAALDAARSGDTILLAPGATYSGNFKLPVHGGSEYVTIRSAASDHLLPPAGARMTPAYSSYLPRIVSPNGSPVLRTAPGAAYWRLQFLEIGPAGAPSATVVDLGDGTQTSLSVVPHHLMVDRVFIRGHALNGQRRGIGLNSSHTTIINSHIADMKLVGQDSQAIGGWNGPGPFHIENNYLEGAGEVLMIGGDDPRIPLLSPSDIVIRGNTLTRPLAWRQPILTPPTGTRLAIAGGGTLPAGTYSYRVVARRLAPGTTIRSAAAAQVSVTTSDAAAIEVRWDAVAGATEYLVYGRLPNGQTQYWRTTATTFVDNGSLAGTAGTPPSSGTVWQVKNIFELKNARRVQVDFNILENNWEQAQTGAAVLFTPRNQYGNCTWCIVEDVVFEYNVVRRTAGGMQLLGWDNERPSAQANNLTIRHNEFSELGKEWGVSAYLFYVIDAPRNVTIDHNTLISNNGSGIINADKRPAENFVFTNNVMRHNRYGIIGTGTAIGMGSITHYLPGSRIEANVIAGGSALNYPAGNFFPTTAAFEANFVAYAARDYDLTETSAWRNAGTDGLDLGADVDTLRSRRDPLPIEPIIIETASLPVATETQEYIAGLRARGGMGSYTWRLIDGALPDGIVLEPSGDIHGSARAFGDFTITVSATDGWGTSASKPLLLHVERAIPDVVVTTATLPAAVATVPYAVALEATGGTGAYAWALADGILPSGLELTSQGVIQGSPSTAGTAVFTVTATDTTNAQRRDARTLQLIVGPPPNRAPSIAWKGPGTGDVVAVGATVPLTVTASDTDGVVTRVDFFVDDIPLASAAGPEFSVPWFVDRSGKAVLTAVAIDDRGGSASSEHVAITPRSEIVLYASDVAQMAGNYQLVPNATTAGGVALWNRNLAAAKVATAAAAPASYAEFTFHAEAGRPYQLWIRGRAEWNDPANDAVHIQFDGTAGARIGTTQSRVVILEETALAGLAGWGWQDTGYGVGVLGLPIVFERTGVQTLRLQPREDGLLIDQIVISPERYLLVAPGSLKNDATIVAK